MNKQNKKPVLWRMLLKRVAILAVIFMIVYVVSNYVAYAFYEVAYTNANKLKLIEINIRVQGQIYSSTLAGVNFPYLELKYYLGEELPKFDIRAITMIRYFEDIELID